MKKQTLQWLKTMAASNDLTLELIWRHGIDVEANPDKIPSKQRGIRRILRVRSYGFDIEIASQPGHTSMLEIARSKLCAIDNDILSVFNPGVRPTTPEEQDMLNRWRDIEHVPSFEEQARVDALTDSSSTYWHKKAFFYNKGGKNYTYLLDRQVLGQTYADGRAIIKDKCVAGDLALVYRIGGLPAQ